jgi:Spy/CpxP family protein refolding chaperone
MFLLGAFLTGGAVGFAADRAVTRSRPARQFDERAGRDSLAKELNLTADQRRVIDSVMDWRRARSREIMQLYRPMLDTVRDSGRVLMMQALDSAQQVKFKALIEHNRRTADSIMRTREDNK